MRLAEVPEEAVGVEQVAPSGMRSGLFVVLAVEVALELGRQGCVEVVGDVELRWAAVGVHALAAARDGRYGESTRGREVGHEAAKPHRLVTATGDHQAAPFGARFHDRLVPELVRRL